MKAILKFESYYPHSFVVALAEMAPGAAIAGGIALLLAALGVLGGIVKAESLTPAPALNTKALNTEAKSEGCECGVWKVSVAAMTAGAALDAVSSHSRDIRFEKNPMYRGVDGRISNQGTLLRVGLPLMAAGLQRFALARSNSKWARTAFTVVNFIAAGSSAGIAAKNWKIK